MDRFITPGALPAIAAIFFLGTFAGGVISVAFRVYFWNEDRIRRTAAQVVDLAVKSDAFAAFVEKIAAAAFTGRAEVDNTFRARIAADMKQMRERADGQSQSIVEAHRRIDTILEKMFGAVSDRARDVATLLGVTGEAKR